MQVNNNIKIGHNRKKLIKLVLIVFITWLINFIVAVFIFKTYRDLDSFIFEKYIVDNWGILNFIPILIVGYLWYLGSFLILIIGVYNLFLIKKNHEKFKVIDFVIVLFPIILFLIKIYVRFPSIEPSLNLPIY